MTGFHSHDDDFSLRTAAWPGFRDPARFTHKHNDSSIPPENSTQTAAAPKSSHPRAATSRADLLSRKRREDTRYESFFLAPSDTQRMFASKIQLETPFHSSSRRTFFTSFLCTRCQKSEEITLRNPSRLIRNHAR